MFIDLFVLCGVAARAEGLYILGRRGSATAVLTRARPKSREHRDTGAILCGDLSRDKNNSLERRASVENPTDNISVAAMGTKV